MGITLYGIPNCDSVKKARQLLDGRGVGYTFHDYRKSGVPVAELRHWVSAKGWETLLNRKGTTWRALDDALQQSVHDAESAVAVMLAHPSTIQRPVVVAGPVLIIGVDTEALAGLG